MLGDEQKTYLQSKNSDGNFGYYKKMTWKQKKYAWWLAKKAGYSGLKEYLQVSGLKPDHQMSTLDGQQVIGMLLKALEAKGEILAKVKPLKVREELPNSTRYYNKVKNGRRKGKQWKPEEDKLLLDHKMMDTDLAKYLERTLKAVHRRREKLKAKGFAVNKVNLVEKVAYKKLEGGESEMVGLGKSWSQEEEMLLKEEWGKNTLPAYEFDRLFGEKVGRTTIAIRFKRLETGLRVKAKAHKNWLGRSWSKDEDLELANLCKERPDLRGVAIDKLAAEKFGRTANACQQRRVKLHLTHCKTKETLKKPWVSETMKKRWAKSKSTTRVLSFTVKPENTQEVLSKIYKSGLQIVPEENQLYLQ